MHVNALIQLACECTHCRCIAAASPLHRRCIAAAHAGARMPPRTVRQPPPPSCLHPPASTLLPPPTLLHPPSCRHPPASTLLPPSSCSLRVPARRTRTTATRTRAARAASTTTSRASSSRPTRPGASTEAEAGGGEGRERVVGGGSALRRRWRPRALTQAMCTMSMPRAFRFTLPPPTLWPPCVLASSGSEKFQPQTCISADWRAPLGRPAETHVEEGRPREVRLLVQGGGDRRFWRGQVQLAVALHSKRVQPRMPCAARTQGSRGSQPASTGLLLTPRVGAASDRRASRPSAWSSPRAR